MPLDDRVARALALARRPPLRCAPLLRSPVGLADLQLPHGVSLLHLGQDLLDVEEAGFFVGVGGLVFVSVFLFESVSVNFHRRSTIIAERRRETVDERLALEAVPTGRSPVRGRHRVAFGAPGRDGPRNPGSSTRGRRRQRTICGVGRIASPRRRGGRHRPLPRRFVVVGRRAGGTHDLGAYPSRVASWGKGQGPGRRETKRRLHFGGNAKFLRRRWFLFLKNKASLSRFPPIIFRPRLARSHVRSLALSLARSLALSFITRATVAKKRGLMFIWLHSLLFFFKSRSPLSLSFLPNFTVASFRRRRRRRRRARAC